MVGALPQIPLEVSTVLSRAGFGRSGEAKEREKGGREAGIGNPRKETEDGNGGEGRAGKREPSSSLFCVNNFILPCFASE